MASGSDSILRYGAEPGETGQEHSRSLAPPASPAAAPRFAGTAQAVAQIVCSYCNAVMAAGKLGAPVSHGCCDECWPGVRAAAGLKPKPYPTFERQLAVADSRAHLTVTK